MKRKRDDFKSYPDGTIIAGIQHVVHTNLGNENHECFQFYSLKKVLDCAAEYCTIAGMRSITIVTHDGGYKNMKALWTWSAL